MDSKAKVGDNMVAAVVTRPELAEEFKAPAFTYKFECFDAAGRMRWAECITNLVTTEGKNNLLDVYFDAATQITGWYLGLKGTGNAAAGDTLASHAGWAEVTPYSGNRPAITFGEPSSGTLAASSAISYTITGSASVYGGFITSATSGTTGTLYSAGDFASPRTVSSGDTLNVTPTVTAS